MTFSDKVRMLSLSESLITDMTSMFLSFLYHWTLALLEVILIILTLNFLPCTWNFNFSFIRIKSALYLENQFDPIRSSFFVEFTILSHPILIRDILNSFHLLNTIATYS